MLGFLNRLITVGAHVRTKLPKKEKLVSLHKLDTKEENVKPNVKLNKKFGFLKRRSSGDEDLVRQEVTWKLACNK
ncbi:unnamed protein product [Heligmosomoides polygyrus]|uniref:60S ribosomal protein L6 n=1 Tax=Heligmosomoides polygyrus TaxID=6339 RepID=A0A183FWB5_HELPZ|nr:unnamed protein product [Heligmosomoides polygyrus]